MHTFAGLPAKSAYNPILASQCVSEDAAAGEPLPQAFDLSQEPQREPSALDYVLQHQIAFSKSRPSSLSILDLLGHGEHASPRKRTSKHISIDAEGRWGVNVAWNKRYYYTSRDAARCGTERHAIGQFGRIA